MKYCRVQTVHGAQYAEVIERAGELWVDRLILPFEEGPASGGERDLPAGAHEQVGAEDALQIADLVAQRGLRDVEARRCPAEVQLLRDSKEIAQEPRLEIHSRKLSPARRTGLGRPPSPAS